MNWNEHARQIVKKNPVKMVFILTSLARANADTETLCQCFLLSQHQ